MSQIMHDFNMIISEYKSTLDDCITDNVKQSNLYHELWNCVHVKDQINEQKDLDYSLLYNQYGLVKKIGKDTKDKEEYLHEVLKDRISKQETEIKILSGKLYDSQRDKNDFLISKENEISIQNFRNMGSAKDVLDLKNALETARHELDRKGRRIEELMILLRKSEEEIAASHNMVRHYQNLLDSKNYGYDEASGDRLESDKIAPEVFRVDGPKTIEIIYEKDDELVKRNKQLADDLERAILEEQNARLKLGNVMNELEHTKKLYKDLEEVGHNPRSVYVPKEVKNEIIKNARIGDRIEQILDVNDKYNVKPMNQVQVLCVLYYYNLYIKICKENEKSIYFIG